MRGKPTEKGKKAGRFAVGDSMLASFANYIGKLKIVLASQSPRRQSILKENLGLTFDIVVSGFAEDIDKQLFPRAEDYVSATCQKKAEAVCETILVEDGNVDVVISADTVVVNQNCILEKPSSQQHAVDMLKQLSGSSHYVLTAVTIAVRKDCCFDAEGNKTSKMSDVGFEFTTFVEKTEVDFAELDESFILSYVQSGEPMDKAGGYGIQSLGSTFVRGIRGCYFNVVGFPVHRFATHFVNVLRSRMVI